MRLFVPLFSDKLKYSKNNGVAPTGLTSSRGELGSSELPTNTKYCLQGYSKTQRENSFVVFTLNIGIVTPKTDFSFSRHHPVLIKALDIRPGLESMARPRYLGIKSAPYMKALDTKFQSPCRR